MKAWENLSPNAKRMAIIGGAFGALAMLVTVFGPDDGSVKRKKEEKVIKSVLTDSDTRTVTMDAISGDLTKLNRDKELQQRDIDKLKRELENLDEAKTEQEKKLRDELRLLRQELDRLDRKTEEARKVAEEGAGKGATTEDGIDEEVANAEVSDQPDEVFRDAPLPKPQPTEQRGKAGGEAQANFSIRSINEGKPGDTDEQAKAEEDDGVYIPSGSIISGVLQTGLDAPTGVRAARNPIPVLLRVKADAILPNQFRADVKECLAVLSGYGDLSSERAYLRGETFSCIRHDSSVVEAKLEGTAVGEDGKAGLRGRLVSKQGQLVARAALAGFFQGASEAFDVNPVPVLSTTPTGEQQYQDVLSDSALQGAGIKGASTALGKVADFYMNLADSIFPVIEIEGVRTVDLMLTKGLKLRIGKGGSGNTEVSNFSYE